MKFRGGFDKFPTSRKAISKYGMTFGCLACWGIERRGHKQGRWGYQHNETCRQRVFNEMMKDPQYRALVDKHGKMKNIAEATRVTDKEVELDLFEESNVRGVIAHVARAIMVLENNRS